MGIAQESLITPENLHNIIIRYSLQQGGIQSGMPSIYCVYGVSNQQRQIDLSEVRNYINYLQIRATLEGKTVIATQFTNNYTIIGVGIENGGNAFIGQPALSPTDPCGVVPNIYYVEHPAPPIVGDIIYTDINATIPLIGFDKLALANGTIFNLDPLTGEVLSIDAATCASPPVPTVPATITYQLDGVNFDAPKTLAASQNVTSITGNSVANASDLPCSVTFKLPQRGFGSLDQDYTVPLNTLWQGTGDGLGNWLIESFYYGAGGVQTVNIITRQAASQDVVKLSIISTSNSPIGVFPYDGTLGGYSKQAGGIEHEMNLFNTPAYCGKVRDLHVNDQYYCIAQSPYNNPSWVIVRFKKLGVFVSSKVYQCDNLQIFFQIIQTDLPNYGDYDELNFEFINGAGGAGVPVEARVNPLEGGVCAAAATLFYTIDGSLTPGNILYEDIAMTIPHLGDSFLADPFTGVINNLNPATGQIGIPTGNSC